jgi:hypothetical protein
VIICAHVHWIELSHQHSQQSALVEKSNNLIAANKELFGLDGLRIEFRWGLRRSAPV